MDNSTPIKTSALAYQHLYIVHFEKVETVDEILDEYDGEIGLFGPGYHFIFTIVLFFGFLRSFYFLIYFHVVVLFLLVSYPE